MFWKSRKNTFIALKSRASAVPKTVMIATPRTPTKSAGTSGDQPTLTHATKRISVWGNVWIADTITAATGNISRGIAILRTIALLRTIERVPEVKVSVKYVTT